MSALTEVEIFARLVESLREASEAAEELSTRDVKGPAYSRLREHLMLIEGSCRQASAWRQDTRWLDLGQLAAECHKRAGGWLRGHKDTITKIRTPLAMKTKNQNFLMLAQNLRFFLKGVEKLKDAKTGRVGMILPAMPAANRRIGAPVPGHSLTSGGIIVPRTLQ